MIVTCIFKVAVLAWVYAMGNVGATCGVGIYEGPWMAGQAMIEIQLTGTQEQCNCVERAVRYAKPAR